MLDRIRPAVWWSAATVFMLVVYLSYFASFPIPEFFSKFTSCVLIAALLLGARCLGGILLRRVSLDGPMWFVVVTKTGLGIGTLGTVIAIVGLVIPGFLNATLSLLAIALLCVTAAAWHVGEVKIIFRRSNGSPFGLSAIEAIVAGVPAMAAGLVLLSCFSPITYYDSLVYHLALPAIYLQQGSIAPVSFNLYSFFPQLMEMLYLFLMRFQSVPDSSINLLGFMMSVGTAMVLGEWAHELKGRVAALLVFILWWSCPAVLFLSIGAYVDIPLAFWTLLALRSFDCATRCSRRGFYFLAGLFAGFAMSTKYTGASTIILIGCFVVYQTVRSKLPLKNLILFLSGSILGPVPWLLRNFVILGNPVFPFGYHWMGSGQLWSTATAERYFRLLTEYDHKSQFIDWLIHTPLLLINQPMKFGGGFDVLGDFGWPLLLITVFIYLLAAKEHRWIGWYAVVSLMVWYFSKPVLRFLVPVLPLFILLAAISIVLLMNWAGRRRLWFCLFFVVPWLVSNLFIYLLFAQDLKLFDVAIGTSARQEFLNQRLAYQPVYSFANENLSDQDRVFLLGEQRTYGLHKSFIAGNLFADSPIASSFNRASSDEQARDFFHSNHITYLLISEAEITRLGGLTAFGFDASGSANLSRFLQAHTTIAYENRAVKLCRIN